MKNIWISEEQVADRTKAGRPVVMISALDPAAVEPPRPQVRILPKDKQRRRKRSAEQD